jgi:hypothetical protein
VDIKGAVIMCNNASCALLAFQKGIFFTTFLQQTSMRVARAAAVPLASMLYLHASGQVLIDEGVDDLSIDTAISIAWPATSSLLWNLLQLDKFVKRQTNPAFGDDSITSAGLR